MILYVICRVLELDLKIWTVNIFSIVFFFVFGEYLYTISIKKFSKNFQIIWRIKPMMNYCMERWHKAELRHL